MKPEKLLELIERYLVYAIVLLVPLVVSGSFSNIFVVPKLVVLAGGVGVILLLKAARLMMAGTLETAVARYDVPVGLLALAYGLAGIFVTPNKMEAFLLPGTATLVVASALLYFVINQLGNKEKEGLKDMVVVSAGLVSLLSLLAMAGILGKVPQLPALMKLSTFTSLGGPLPAAIFLAVVAPLGVSVIINTKDVAKKTAFAVATGFIILGLGVNVYNSLPGKSTSPRLLDFGSSWAITVDSLKDSPLFGVGPGNYLTAFNRFRPLAFNQSDNWSLRFTQGRSFFMSAVTEAGLVAALSLILLLLTLFKMVKKTVGEINLESLDGLPVLMIVVALVIFPSTPSLVFALFVLLALSNKAKRAQLALPEVKGDSLMAVKLPALLLAAPIVAGVLVFGFFAAKSVAAEAKFGKALTYLSQNKGTETYDALRDAINLSPRVDRYHATYAQVNMALAQSLSQSPDITTEQRNTIAQLIQQAIREGKATVTLNQTRASNWEILASIYRAIMPFAQGADTFTVQVYQQAVALDPVNPNLRIALGGVHYALGNFDDAIKAFDLATIAKPDLANAHFNLAAAYREKGETQKAISEMETVLSLVEKGTPDYDAAIAEMDRLEKNKLAPTGIQGEEGTAEGSQLTPPQPAEEPVLTPPLQLPEEATPPEVPSETGGTPAPSPTPLP